MNEELTGKYLTFKLENEEYGLQIMKVHEIIGMMNVTRVPRMPDFLRGVINLRGKLIPVVDLRNKFSLPHQKDTLKTCIIVVQISVDAAKVVVGIIVDSVSEVLHIENQQIEPAMEFGTRINTEFLLGLGKIDGKVVILLNIDHVLNLNDNQGLQQILKQQDQTHPLQNQEQANG